MYPRFELSQSLHHPRGVDGATVMQMTAKIPKTNTKAAIRERHLKWLDDVQRWTKKSLSRLATEAGLSDTTLTRFIRKGYDGTLNDVTIARLIGTHGVPGPDDDPAERARRPLYAREEAALYVSEQEPDIGVRRAVEALVGKRADTYAWRLKTRAVELKGYLPGDIVITDARAAPVTGDAVCAQVVDYRRGTAETVWRIYEETGGVRLLTPKSLDPVVLPTLVVDDDRVAISAVIIAAVRPGRAAA